MSDHGAKSTTNKANLRRLIELTQIVGPREEEPVELAEIRGQKIRESDFVKVCKLVENPKRRANLHFGEIDCSSYTIRRWETLSQEPKFG